MDVHKYGSTRDHNIDRSEVVSIVRGKDNSSNKHVSRTKKISKEKFSSEHYQTNASRVKRSNDKNYKVSHSESKMNFQQLRSTNPLKKSIEINKKITNK